MLAFLTEPFVWFAAASVVGSCMAGYIVYEAFSFELRRRGYEPAIDLDALQAELDAEFAPLSVRAGK